MASEAAPRTRRSRLGPRSAGLSMTPEEFDATPSSRWAEGYRYELIRGVLIVSPPPAAAERGPNDVLGHLLRVYQGTDPAGSAMDETLPEHDVVTPANRRRCDRAIWVGLGRMPDPRQDLPAIVIEFVSESKRDFLRDYEEKRAEYLAAGVVEYWIIDRFRRIMTIYRAEGPVETVVPEAGTYRTGLLPGFDLPIARLLAKADDWSRKRRPRPKPKPTGGS